MPTEDLDTGTYESDLPNDSTLMDQINNLDLSAEKELTLADVLGEHWVEICNESIRTQMAESADPSAYFDESMGGFTTVDGDTSFYIDADGNAVVVFTRGAVAIGAMGIVEFVCTVPEGRLGTFTSLS